MLLQYIDIGIDDSMVRVLPGRIYDYTYVVYAAGR